MRDDLPMLTRIVPRRLPMWIGESIMTHAAGGKKSRKALIFGDNP